MDRPSTQVRLGESDDLPPSLAGQNQNAFGQERPESSDDLSPVSTGHKKSPSPILPPFFRNFSENRKQFRTIKFQLVQFSPSHVYKSFRARASAAQRRSLSQILPVTHWQSHQHPLRRAHRRTHRCTQHCAAPRRNFKKYSDQTLTLRLIWSFLQRNYSSAIKRPMPPHITAKTAVFAQLGAFSSNMWGHRPFYGGAALSLQDPPNQTQNVGLI